MLNVAWCFLFRYWLFVVDWRSCVACCLCHVWCLLLVIRGLFLVACEVLLVTRCLLLVVCGLGLRLRCFVWLCVLLADCRFGLFCVLRVVHCASCVVNHDVYGACCSLFASYRLLCVCDVLFAVCCSFRVVCCLLCLFVVCYGCVAV